MENVSDKYPHLEFKEVYFVANVLQEMKKNPNFLDSAPYSDNVKQILQSMLPPPPPPVEEKHSGSEKKVLSSRDVSKVNFDDIDLVFEIKYLYMQTKNLMTSENISDKDMMALSKTGAAQLEKLLELNERAVNDKYRKEFEDRVLRALRKALPEQREEFLKILSEEEKFDILK